ncbi:PH domain-containing protein [Opacimonas viscosa]|jgi:hypothetical protein|uniref:PH domain-containing protein n=1 Tax=Opacimonas viscosa TaxID=2961944 RepID=A0AA41WZ59_9ALTE|nr:PH domain-containing protein [Opacimonas viscosa]MCP3429199.1 PH domain-containing protein [Opacimonas viscosa]
MGLLDGLLGNASEVDITEVREELGPVLADGESVTKAYVLVRDMIVFTTARMIMVDKQGITGRKVEYHSIPYKSVTQFKVETAGRFDMESELKIYISGQSTPLEVNLTPECAMGVQQALASNLFK